MKKIAARDVYGEKLVELGKENPNIVVLDADLSSSTKTSVFQKAFPNRHFNMGIAENNMMLFAAGLAVAGKTVFASSFAMFATGRPWEIIRNSVAYDNLNVKIVATHAGISVGEDGGAHQANEDMAIMRAIPNFKVFCPADAIEAGHIIEYAAKNQGPMYIRLSREAFPAFMNQDNASCVTKGKILLDGNDLTIIATGSLSWVALQVAKLLEKEKISAQVIHIPCIKPIDKEIIIDSAKKTKYLFTCEEHSVLGGLGSAVAEVVCEYEPVPVIRLGVPDEFGQSGKPQELFKLYGLTAEDISKKIIKKQQER